ncbi:MAG: vWA domain-containing protein, partial [Planctomycetota bacterium]
LKKRLSLRIADKDADDEGGLRRAFAMLAGSAVGGQNDARYRLLQRVLDLASDEISDVGRQASSQSVSASEDREALVALPATNLHPWTGWLNEVGGVELPQVTAGDLRGEGAILRKHAAQMLMTNNQEPLETARREANSGSSAAVVRRRMAAWDTQIRARSVAALTSRCDVASAGGQRESIDLQLFFMRHAKRTLAEFWCGPRRGDAPFFPDAANRLLRAVSRTTESRLPAILDGEDLSQSIAAATQAVQSGRTLKPLADPVLYEDVRGSNVEVTLATSTGLPDGHVAIWPQPGAPSAMRLARDDVNAQSMAQQHPVRIPKDLGGNVLGLEIDAFFRGLRRQGSIGLNRRGQGVTTLFRLPRYDAPRVIVTRDRQQKIPVMIVFDCSNSMNDGGKLDAAQRALINFLDQLAPEDGSEGDFQVGLIAYGSQWGWQDDPTRPGTQLIDRRRGGLTQYKAWDGGAQENWLPLNAPASAGNPNRDVVLIQTLGRRGLTNERFLELAGKIGSLEAIGVTPVYEAIDRAYEVIVGRGRSETAHVIVLTDGKPFVAASKGSVDPFRLRARDIVNKHPWIRLQIVGYDLPSAKQTFQEALGPPGQSGQDSVFDWIDAGREDLEQAFMSSLPRPRVKWTNRGKAISSEASLGQPQRIQGWPPVELNVADNRPVRPAIPRSVTVTGLSDFRSGKIAQAQADVQVEGGEYFHLKLRGETLVHDRYDFSSQAKKQLQMSGYLSDQYKVTMLQPGRLEAGKMTLPIVIENASPESFTRRPTDIWVELKTSNNRGEQSFYVVNLPQYRAGRRVPVLECTVANWPVGASLVSMRAWIRFEPAKQTELPLDRIGQPIADLFDNVEFLIQRSSTAEGGSQLKVTERHAGGSSPNRFRVLTAPLPSEATIQTFKDQVVRTFVFEQPYPDLRATVSEADDIKADAMTNQQPESIQVPL